MAINREGSCFIDSFPQGRNTLGSPVCWASLHVHFHSDLGRFSPPESLPGRGWEQSVHKSTWDVLCIHVWAASNWLGSSGFLLYFGY